LDWEALQKPQERSAPVVVQPSFFKAPSPEPFTTESVQAFYESIEEALPDLENLESEELKDLATHCYKSIKMDIEDESSEKKASRILLHKTVLYYLLSGIQNLDRGFLEYALHSYLGIFFKELDIKPGDDDAMLKIAIEGEQYDYETMPRVILFSEELSSSQYEKTFAR